MNYRKGCICILAFFVATTLTAQKKLPARPRAIVLAEPNGIHRPFVDTAIMELKAIASQNGFDLDVIESTEKIGQHFLANYKLFVQLDYPPYRWSDSAKADFQKAIREGKINWIGFHHATLLGEFDGFKIWPWFSEFMGGIRWKNYIGDFAAADVKVEAKKHPVTKGLPSEFRIDKEEWYTWDKSPRENVHVLISVDESSYTPSSSVKMGDHPVVWTNPKIKARNLYIFMGHHGGLFNSPSYKLLFENAIKWGIGKNN